MITIDLITDYLAHRRKGFSPSSALALARDATDADTLLDCCEETACDSDVYDFESDALPDDWTCRITVEPDEYPDLSWIGVFRNGNVDRDIVDGLVNHRRRRGDSRQYPSFAPANDYVDVRKWYADHGYSKHAADCNAKRQVLEDYNRLADYGDGWISLRWHIEVCNADGAEAYADACGGFESDSDYHLTQAAEAAEALCARAQADSFASIPQR